MYVMELVGGGRKWWIRIKSGNGKILLQSPGIYKSRNAARKVLKRLFKCMGNCAYRVVGVSSGIETIPDWGWSD